MTEADSHSGSFFADGRAIRRSRSFALFLAMNWLVMGAFVLSAGLRSLVGGVAFAFGLMALLGALSQLRGARLATRLPLVEVEPTLLRLRPYTAKESNAVPFSEIKRVERPGQGSARLLLASGAYQTLPGLTLSRSELERLLTAIEHELERGAPRATEDGS
jgi:hypothetical protein